MEDDQTYKFLVFATVLDPDVRLAGLVDDFEGEVLEIGLDFGIGEFTANETLCIEDTGVDDQNISIEMHDDTGRRLTCCGGSWRLDSSRHRR